MSLRERLRAMQAAGSTDKQSAVQRPYEEQEVLSELAVLQGARLVETPFGKTVCVEHRYALSDTRGSVALGTAKGAPISGWRFLLRGSACDGFSIENCLFIDTETTGLERGTGTYAFLVGVGRIVGDAFRIRQYLMRDYHEEPAIIHLLMEELADAAGLVTFNGKTFDWPLLQTRAILNRQTLPDLPHLDLLHPARRFWQAVTSSCRLTQLEVEILGVVRVGDIPGELIPSIYFEYLSARNAELLAPILEHNRYDLLTTLALAGYLAEGAARPLTAQPAGRLLPGSDLYAIARVLADDGRIKEATTLLEEALKRGLPSRLRWPCVELLASLYKRLRRFDRAVPLWYEMAAHGASAPAPHVELAKYFEHQEKDFWTARQWTLEAMRCVQQRRLMRGLGRPSAGRWSGRDLAELAHRLERLESRIAREEAT